ncbi:MAG TPA: glycosyltransferase family 2 protein, partial [Rhodospirillales bacterium]|nr:glycosyltransferase family 2 protein [Rhodospirillales bacterium]
MTAAGIRLSVVISVHNEEAQLAECLEGLIFADEIVVLL